MAQLRTVRSRSPRWPSNSRLSRRRCYELYHDYLRACAQPRNKPEWTPGCSGGPIVIQRGCHAVTDLLRKLLSARPPASYSFAASEVHRRLGVGWRGRKCVAGPSNTTWPFIPAPHVPRRWSSVGSGKPSANSGNWTPPRTLGFPAPRSSTRCLDLIDDCSRLVTGAKLYEREVLLAYFDLLPTAFAQYGLPLALYVDCHSFFLAQRPRRPHPTGRGPQILRHLPPLRPQPQAKGKVERLHLFWQNRLPALFAAEALSRRRPGQPLDPATAPTSQPPRTPPRTGDDAPPCLDPRLNSRAAACCVPNPACPWWPFIWSLRVPVKVTPDGTVPVGSQRLKLAVSPGTKVIRCQHPDGSYSILAEPPRHDTLPLLLLRYGPSHNTPQH